MEQYIVNLITAVDLSKKETIAAEVGERLGMTRAKVLKLLEQEPGPITKPVSKAIAERVAQALQAAGVEAEAAPHDWQDVLLLSTKVQTPQTDPIAQAEVAVEPTITPEVALSHLEEVLQTPEPTLNSAPESMTVPPFAKEDGEDLSEPSTSYDVTSDEADGAAALPESPADDTVTQTAAPAMTAQSPTAWRWLGPLLLLFMGVGLAFVILPNIQSVSTTTPALEDEPVTQSEDAQPDEPAGNTVAPEPAEAEATESTEVEEAALPPNAEEAAEPDTSAEAPTEEVSDLGSEPLTAPEEAGPLAELEASAEAGNLDAQLELAERYAAGEGVELDLERSAVWFERAAAAGDEGAQYELGWLYANGLGVERDLEAATRWYEAAALSGNAEAQYQLGFYRYFGQGGSQDLSEARSLFRAAAEKGVAEARFRLGVMYLEGEGGEIDLDEAGRWLRLANEQGVTEAVPYLERLEASLESSTEAEQDLTEAQVDTSVQPVSNTTDLDTQTSTDGLQLLSAQESLSEIDKTFFEVVKTEDAAAIAETIRAGANVNARDTYGQTPLMYAASYNGPNAIAELIVDLADVNAQSAAGWSALMYAARDNPEVVESLLVRGADPTLTNSDGQTALDIARAANSPVLPLLEASLAELAPEAEDSGAVSPAEVGEDQN